MTKIEAINLMLSVINEQPINSLNEGYIESNLADRILEEVSNEIQSKGWWFNYEKDYEIKQTTDGYIYLTSDILSVDGTSNTDDYVQRGNKLYDRGNKTYTFTSSVIVDIVFKLDFEELPFIVQHYITVRAARKFQSRLIGSNTLFAYTEKEEEEARIKLIIEENDKSDYNLLDNQNLISLY